MLAEKWQGLREWLFFNISVLIRCSTHVNFSTKTYWKSGNEIQSFVHNVHKFDQLKYVTCKHGDTIPLWLVES